MPRLFVLDAMGLVYRAFHALLVRRRLSDAELEALRERRAAEGKDPDRVDAFVWEPLRDRRGEAVNAILGFANTVLKIRREEEPDYWALAWDGPGPTQRHERYPGYKADRKPIPDDLLTQIPAIEDLAQALGLPVLEQPGLEADDVMATLAVRGVEAGFEVALVTSDKDMLQLVGPRIRLLSPVGRGEDYTWVDPDRVRAQWGVEPEQVRDVLALMGDSIDCVPGVPGIGQKTAVELIQRFGSLEGIYAHLQEVPRPSVKKKLEEHREQALISQELVTVCRDCPLPFTWEALAMAPIRRDTLLALAKRYELQRIQRLAGELGVPDAEAGPPVLARPAERRGSVAETEGTGVRLAPRDDVTEAEAADAEAGAATLFDAEAATDDAEPDEMDALDERPFMTGRDRPSRGAPSAPTMLVPPLPADTRPFALAADASVALAPEPAATPADARSVEPASGHQIALDLFTSAAGERNFEQLLERLHAVRARSIHGLSLLPIAALDEPRRASVIGIALAARDGASAYAPIAHREGPNLSAAQIQEWLAPMLADRATAKVGWDLKRDRHALEASALALEGMAFDLHLGSFVCDPERDHSLEALARDVLGVALPPNAAALAKAGRRPLESLSVAETADAAERAVATMIPIAQALRAQIESREQWPLYERIEHPLIEVLVDMERTGIRVDRAVLAAMSERAAQAIAGLEAELHALAGEPVNLNSGPQLARVLFQKLGLKAGRRTKTGFSTDQAVLEELARQHPFPAKLLEYRALTKLASTYLDALPLSIDPRDHRVHTTYEQTGAATGRLSSSAPNLQNIPMRSPEGREIRRAFIAPEGRVLIGADYSQIELRVMAHLSGDPNLIEAFERGEDVHTTTARKIFGLTEGPLDPGLRARAKIVNFGVMYGMGARSLSQQMGIGLAEAQDFIRNYFRVFSRVRAFLDRTLDEARAKGYATTLFGRRRYLADLAGDSGARRSFAERAAINTPIQGSAADLMKLAMLRVHGALKRAHPSAKLLLQVHDELLLEAPIDEAELVMALVRSEMERCVPLRVPLEVSVGRGGTWLDAH